jgi:putative CocE/NonD family hydrolase
MVFKPRGHAAPLPVIVEMTPYGVDMLYADGVAFANEGFVFVAVDCRGTGDSEGTFAPVVNDAADYAAVFDWLVTQPWCDGQVATHGGSYSGMNQWLALGTGHPALRTIVPVVAPLPLPVAGGVGSHFHLDWSALAAGHGTYKAWGSDDAYWGRVLGAIGRGEIAKGAETNQLFGDDQPWQQYFRDHPTHDSFWAPYLPSPEMLERCRLPTLSINGQADLFIAGALEYHRRLMKWGHEDARRQAHLVIGPWNHAGTHIAQPQVGSLCFGDAARIDVKGLTLAWYRWVMQGGPRPAMLAHRVQWYAAGEEAWHGCDRLEDVTTGTQVQALAAGPGPNDIFHSGWLGTDLAETAPDRFICDPNDEALLDIEHRERADDAPLAPPGAPRPLSRLYMALSGEEPTAQAYAAHLRGQGLVYHSAPLDEPMALAGTPELQLRCTVDQPDADLAMLLYEIRADGQAIFLSSDLLRLRYRHGPDQALLVTPGEAMTLRFGTARFFARTLARHSRLRLVVRHAMGLIFERNGNSGKPVNKETRADRRVATVTVIHDGQARSRLVLPLAAQHGVALTSLRKNS